MARNLYLEMRLYKEWGGGSMLILAVLLLNTRSYTYHRPLDSHVFILHHNSFITFGYSGVANELCLTKAMSCSSLYFIQYIQITSLVIIVQCSVQQTWLC